MTETYTPNFMLETNEELELAFFALGYTQRLMVRKNMLPAMMFMKVNQELSRRGYEISSFPLSLSKKKETANATP